MKPIILLTHKFSDEHWGMGRSYKMESNYCRALIKAGALPLLTAGGDPKEMAQMADAVLFTGGGDMEPQRYGETNQYNIRSDSELDEMELALFKEFFNLKKPIFGICRGTQTINVALGGTLYQDIPSQVTLSAHIPYFSEEKICRHFVKATPDSFINRLFGDDVEVNTYHHQAVKVCGKGLRPAAVTDEGVIEAIEHETLPIAAVQWHPERAIGEENTDLPDMMPLFNYFVELCNKSAKDK